MMAPIFWRGLSEPEGSLKTICTDWRSLRRVSPLASVTSTLLSSRRPEVGGSISVTRRARVDLPPPDSPTTARVFPAARVKLAPFPAFRPRLERKRGGGGKGGVVRGLLGGRR